MFNIIILLFSFNIQTEGYLETAKICESVQGSFTCPKNHVIRVVYANFGGEADANCSVGAPLASSTCIRSGTTTKMLQLCENKNNCTLIPSTSMFGDACSGYAKQLTVTYYCLETSNKHVDVLYALGEGCDSKYVRYDKGGVCVNCRCQMLVNGVAIPPAGVRGFNVAWLDGNTLEVKERKSFDTHDDTTASTQMITWVNNLPDGALLMLCSMDSAVQRASAAVWTLLESLGFKDVKTTLRSSHAMIAMKAAPQTLNFARSMSNAANEQPSIVSLSLVKPPSNVSAELHGSNMVEVTWYNNRADLKEVNISYSDVINSASIETSLQVDVGIGKKMIGPLTPDTVNVIQVLSAEPSTSRISMAAVFYVITGSSSSTNLGCPQGVFKLLLGVNGGSSTFSFTSSYWENNVTINELRRMSFGFHGKNVKSREYSQMTFKRMCVGMKLHSRAGTRFIEVTSPDQSKTFLELMKANAATSASRASWLSLIPSDLQSGLQTKCNKEGFKVMSPRANHQKVRFGILGNNEDDCVSCDSALGFGPTGIFGYWPSVVEEQANGYVLAGTIQDGSWSTWGVWSSCISPLSCGTGKISRSRTCTNPLMINGKPCPGVSIGEIACVNNCPIVDSLSGEARSTSQLRLTFSMSPSQLQPNMIIKNYRLEVKKEENDQTISNSLLGPAATQFYQSGLEAYTKYCFTVQILLQDGAEGVKSNAHCLFTAESTPKSQPKNFVGFNTSSQCLNFTWNRLTVKDARGIILGYNIYIKEFVVGDGPMPEETKHPVENVNKTQICRLKPFTDYQASIKGFTKVGEGSIDGQIWITVRTDEDVPIQAPTITYPHNTSSQSIRMTWNRPATIYWQGLPRGFMIFVIKTEDMNGPTHDKHNRTQVIDRSASLSDANELLNLEIYKEYQIWMNAYTIKGHGPNSTVQKAWTDESRPSRSPSSVSAHNISSFGIEAQWASLEQKYRLGVLKGYRVYCKNLDNGAEVYVYASASAIKAEIHNLEPYTNHSIRISAFNIKGFGPNSSSVYTFTDEYVPSKPPDSLFGYNVSSSEIFLRWSSIPMVYRNGVLLGYAVLWRNTSNTKGTWNRVTTNSTSHNVTIANLSAYTNYTFKIAGFTSKGDGNFSAGVIIITGEDAPRRAPEKINVTTNSSSEILIAWQPPQSDVPGIIRGFTISYKPVYSPDDFKSRLLVKPRRKRRAVISTPLQINEANISVAGNTRSFLIRGLHGHTNYSIKILAFTIFDGLWSEVMYIMTPEDKPGMSPMNVTAKATTHRSIMVSWNHVPPAYAHGYIQGYIVFYQKGVHNDVTAFNESQVSTRTYLEITHLAIFQVYSFQVLAYTTAGFGVKSETVHATTKEWVPYRAPPGVDATKYYSPFQINITWHPLALQYWNGNPLGYEVRLFRTGIGGKILHSSEIRKLSYKMNHTETRFDFKAAEPYESYDIQIRAYTAVGFGPSSAKIRADTCNMEKNKFYSSWINDAPFSIASNMSEKANGIIPKLLQSALARCYGHCSTMNGSIEINFIKDGTGSSALKSNVQELQNKLSDLDDFTFPMRKPTFSNPNFQFIELMSVPGAALLEGNLKPEKTGENVAVATKSIIGEMIIFFVFCWLSGVLIWLVETYRKTGQFDKNSIMGSFQGFYWAFTTATTVGYGDMYPSSVPGRVVMMVWALVGMILLSLLSSVLTAELITVEEIVTANMGKSKRLTSGLGVIQNTWEYHAMMKLVTIDKNYTDLQGLIKGLAAGEVRFGILDQYKAFSYQARMKNNDISVKRILDFKGSIGFYAAGHGKKLRSCIETYMVENSVFVTPLVARYIQETERKISEEEEKAGSKDKTDAPLVASKIPKFFSWQSSRMQRYIKISSALLGISVLFGCAYELFKCYRQRKNTKVSPVQSTVSLEHGFHEESVWKMFKDDPANCEEYDDGIIQKVTACERWDILREAILDLKSERDSKENSKANEKLRFKSEIIRQRWQFLKQMTAKEKFNFFPALLEEQTWKRKIAALSEMNQKSMSVTNFISKFYLKIKRNAMIASMNMPGELERETYNMMQDLELRLEQKLTLLDVKHSHQLLQEKKKLHSKYGKFDFINENQLKAPF